MNIFTKEEFIIKLSEISAKGWIPNARAGNHGGIGNTLEDLLGIEENNLPIPNASEWELKAQKLATSSLTTIFHSAILLPKYGWKYKEAGKKYSENEMSFRQTIHGLNYSDRGFKVVIDRLEKKVLILFDSTKVDKKHSAWLEDVAKNVELNELYP